MNFIERPVTFVCGSDRLLGIVSHPACPASTGVLVVVGGPQYRVGSHRQFVLLARRLAAEGFAVMRFDYRGMGDSSGVFRGFEAVEADIGAAIDAFLAACPEVNNVVLWGLCDAASAALLYWGERRDARISGFCLLNPWVRTESGLARAHVKYYYAKRILRPEFWAKLMRGKIDFAGALGGLLRSLRLSVQRGDSCDKSSFQARMVLALDEFQGKVLLILSGNDYTAKEFDEFFLGDQQWLSILKRSRLERREVADADHTFSSGVWRASVEQMTLEWLQGLSNPGRGDGDQQEITKSWHGLH